MNLTHAHFKISAHKTGMKLKPHGERFRMAPFSVIVFCIVVWTMAVSGAKQLRFRLKKDHCGRGQSLPEHSRALTIRVTKGDIHHFTVQAKLASTSEEFSGECFDFDRLSAFCLGGLVLKREQKEAVSYSWKDFSSCGSSSTPR